MSNCQIVSSKSKEIFYTKCTNIDRYPTGSLQGPVRTLRRGRQPKFQHKSGHEARVPIKVILAWKKVLSTKLDVCELLAFANRYLTLSARRNRRWKDILSKSVNAQINFETLNHLYRCMLCFPRWAGHR